MDLNTVIFFFKRIIEYWLERLLGICPCALRRGYLSTNYLISLKLATSYTILGVSLCLEDTKLHFVKVMSASFVLLTRLLGGHFNPPRGSSQRVILAPDGIRVVS